MLKATQFAVQALSHPQQVKTIFHRALGHWDEKNSARSKALARGWAETASRADTGPEIGTPELWEEARLFSRGLKQRADGLLSRSRSRFGGGGFTELLHILVRIRQPKTVVETGVAAGWSSATILSAMRQNGGGQLWSSDFPYVTRTQNVTDEIGLLVPPELRANWHLSIDGDRANLPRILDAVETIDIFHYDSDKSHHSREWALNIVRPKLAPDAVLIFDDIQDNLHFRDFVTAEPQPYRVFAVGNKYVGLLGDMTARAMPATFA